MPVWPNSRKIFARGAGADVGKRGQLGTVGKANGRAAERPSGSPALRRTKAETLFETTLGYPSAKFVCRSMTATYEETAVSNRQSHNASHKTVAEIGRCRRQYFK